NYSGVKIISGSHCTDSLQRIRFIMLFYILCIQANSFSTVRANKMRTIKFNLTFINLIRICQTKHILKILNGATNNISIFKILKNNRKQLYRLVLVSTAEI